MFQHGDSHIVIQIRTSFEKKSNSVCYHAVCKSVAMGKSLVGHIPSKENVADLRTRVPYGQKRRYLISNFLMIFMMTTSYQFRQEKNVVRQA